MKPIPTLRAFTLIEKLIFNETMFPLIENRQSSESRRAKQNTASGGEKTLNQRNITSFKENICRQYDKYKNILTPFLKEKLLNGSWKTWHTVGCLVAFSSMYPAIPALINLFLEMAKLVTPMSIEELWILPLIPFMTAPIWMMLMREMGILYLGTIFYLSVAKKYFTENNEMPIGERFYAKERKYFTDFLEVWFVASQIDLLVNLYNYYTRGETDLISLFFQLTYHLFDAGAKSLLIYSVVGYYLNDPKIIDPLTKFSNHPKIVRLNALLNATP